MINQMKNIKTIDEYISQFNRNTQSTLNKLRSEIIEIIPNAEEMINYGIPTFRINDKNIIHFAYYKTHIGIYPGTQAIEKFADELKNFKTSKGTIQVKHIQEIPMDLIKEMIQFNVENL